MIADQRLKEAKEVEGHAEHLLQDKILINAKYGRRSEKARKIDLEEAEAHETATKARRAAAAAEENWLSIISNHHSVLKVQGQGVEAIQAAEEKLKASDEAVLNLWYETKFRHDEREFEEPENRENTKSNLTTLLERRSIFLKNCFEEVDVQLAKARDAYHKAEKKHSEKKEAARLLYDEAAKLETEARKKYVLKVEEQALNAARENLPGAEEAWKNWKDQSEK
jgi:hypothetical protein